MNPITQIALQTSNYDFQFEVDLDGTTFQLRLWWCDTLNGSPIADGSTTGFWMLFLLTPSNMPIVQGRAVVGSSMFWRFAGQPNMPLGKLLLIDTTGQGLSPGMNDLGQRVQLFYMSAFPASAAA